MNVYIKSVFSAQNKNQKLFPKNTLKFNFPKVRLKLFLKITVKSLAPDLCALYYTKRQEVVRESIRL